MSYGYGLGVYWSDYNDPEDSDPWCDGCENYLDCCDCPQIEPIKINCTGCGKEITTMDEGQFTDTLCCECKPKTDPNWEPEY